MFRLFSYNQTKSTKQTTKDTVGKLSANQLFSEKKSKNFRKQKPLKRNVFKGFGLGAICGTRTHDLLITNQLLYQLS